jgi:hypothetical protein
VPCEIVCVVVRASGRRLLADALLAVTGFSVRRVIRIPGSP